MAAATASLDPRASLLTMALSAPHATFTRGPVGPLRAGRGQGRADRGRVVSSRHLSCERCRIRVRADSTEIGLLEGCCPICETTLTVASCASSVVGFRSFDLDTFSERTSDDQSNAHGRAVDFISRLGRAWAQDVVDADRWSDDGGTVNRQAVANYLTR
jgi:hypothetical protein